jgi:hypothetical protein
MLEDSVLQNRPYLGMSTTGHEVQFPRDDSSVVTLKFNIINAGKTPAKITDAVIRKAIITNKISQSIYAKIKAGENIGRTLEIVDLANKGIFTVLPSQPISFGVFKIRGNELHKSISQDTNRIYIEFEIAYSALFFKSNERSYVTEFDMCIPVEGDLYQEREGIPHILLRVESKEVK